MFSKMAKRTLILMLNRAGQLIIVKSKTKKKTNGSKRFKVSNEVLFFNFYEILINFRWIMVAKFINKYFVLYMAY